MYTSVHLDEDIGDLGLLSLLLSLQNELPPASAITLENLESEAERPTLSQTQPAA